MTQDILIAPGSGEPFIDFRATGVPSAIKLTIVSGVIPASGTSELSFEGTQGQLFSISDNLSSGTIFSVSDVTGLPLIEADASGDVKIGEFGRNVGVGSGILPAYQLDVFGTGNFHQGIRFSDGTTQTSAGGAAAVADYASGQATSLNNVSGVATSLVATSGIATYASGQATSLNNVSGVATSLVSTSGIATYASGQATSFNSVSGVATSLVSTSGIATYASGQSTSLNNVSGVATSLVSSSGIATYASGNTANIAFGSNAEGDILYHNGTSFIRLAKGTDDYVLTMNGNVPNWEESSGGGGVDTYTSGVAAYSSGVLTGGNPTFTDVQLGQYIYHDGDADTYLRFGANLVNLVAGGKSALLLNYSTGKIQLNNSNANLDVQIMADDGGVILHTDAGTNRVGIGTSTPAYGLDVVGAGASGVIQATGVVVGSSGIVFSNGTTQTVAGITATVAVSEGGTNATSFADNSVIISQDSGTDTLAALALSTNGQLVIGGSSGPAAGSLASAGNSIAFTASDGGLNLETVGGGPPSDESLKVNVTQLQYSGLETIQQLNPVEFDWNNLALDKFPHQMLEGHDIGLIAQEVEGVVPEIIGSRKEFKTVDYAKLTVILTKAVQELKQEVDELRQEIEQLKNS